MLDDPSTASAQAEQAKTRLFLPAPSTSVTNSTVAHATVHRRGIARNRQEVRLPLAMVLLSLVAITALVLGILFAVVPLLAQQKHSPNTTSTLQQEPSVSASTPPAADATQIPIQGTATIQGLAIQPTHFAVQSDCLSDNGYRCTVTLSAAQSINRDLQWQAASDGINTIKFSPPNGKLEQGQQQQVIVYIYDTCPYNGTLLFAIGNDNLTVPVSC
ncbi:MAG: hypothetical protein PVSMB2_10170 [Ktedonobacteraceae bacterium]